MELMSVIGIFLWFGLFLLVLGVSIVAGFVDKLVRFHLQKVLDQEEALEREWGYL